MRIIRLAAALALLATIMTVAAGRAEAAGKNCRDFSNQAEAQAYLRANPDDPDGLDGPPGRGTSGRPGVACESLACPCDYSNVYTEQQNTPAASPGTPAGPTTTAVITVRDLNVVPLVAPPVRRVARKPVVVAARKTPLASTGPTENAIALSAAGVVLLLVGSRLRGRQAPGEHWV